MNGDHAVKATVGLLLHHRLKTDGFEWSEARERRVSIMTLNGAIVYGLSCVKGLREEFFRTPGETV
ncbi:MAG: hypothetical protein QXS04_02955 [Thermoproteota archaeon]|nr:hypothetical protein [Candidatus Brockarchaeota archaeon]